MKLPHFLTHMNQSALRAVLVSLGLFAIMGVIIIVAREYFDLDGGALGAWLQNASESGLALPITVIVFCMLAFIGAPQVMLIAATVIAFGPVKGMACSYVATLCSAALTFYFGRGMGAKRLRTYGGDFINRFLGVIQRNGFVASLAVRVVPTAPFIIVNMAAGVSGMSVLPFMAGTAIGILPKIAAVAFFSEGVKGAATGAAWPVVLGLIVLGVVWIGIMLLARKRLRRVVDGKPKIKPTSEENRL